MAVTQFDSLALSGVRWTTLSTVIRALLQFVQLAFVARYLSAEAIGLYALVQLSLMFFQLIIDLGISQAIIHHTSVTARQLQQLGFCSVVIGLLLFGLVIVSAPLLAMLFENNALVDLLFLAATVFLFLGCSRVNLAVLQKALAFTRIAKCELLGASVGFAVTLTLIVHGGGVEGLIIGFLSSQLVLTLMLLVTTRTFYFAMPAKGAELSKFFVYGLYRSGDNIVNFFNSQIDLILVGKLLGTEVLGGYSLVRQFCFRPAMVINPVLTKVAFPYFARLKTQPTLLVERYCHLLTSLSWINFPLYIAIALFSEHIIVLLFGEQWAYLAPIMSIMALWCMIRSLANPVGSLLMGIGKVQLALRWNLLLLLVFPLIIYSAAGYGLIGVSVGLLVAQLLTLLGHWYFLLYRTVNLKLSVYLRAFLPSLLVASLSGAIALLVAGLIPAEADWVILATGLGMGAVLCLMFAHLIYPNVWKKIMITIIRAG